MLKFFCRFFAVAKETILIRNQTRHCLKFRNVSSVFFGCLEFLSNLLLHELIRQKVFVDLPNQILLTDSKFKGL